MKPRSSTQQRPLKAPTHDEYAYHLKQAQLCEERGYPNLAQAHRIYAADIADALGIVKQ